MKHAKSLKWLLTLACLLAALCAFTLAADAEIVDSGTCGSNWPDYSNLTWTLDDAGTLTISGTGTMKNYSQGGSYTYTTAPWGGSLSKAQRVRTIDIQNGVTSIGSNAFYGCSGLTSMTIPDSVTSIGYSAFCRCTGLTSLTIPDSVTSIGSSAFCDCTGLTSVAIPNSVTTISSFAFEKCSNLMSMDISDSVTSIESYAFNDCTSLTSVTIPDSVTKIGNGAFSSCTGLTSVSIGNGVTSFGDFVFFDCKGLTSVTIPDSVTSIGNNAFSSCTGLTIVIIPDSIMSIGDGAFSFCNSLKSVCYTGTEEQWNAIQNNSEVKPSSYNCKLESGIVYNQTKTTILTVYDNTITQETIPNNVTSIGNNAFIGCKDLTTITIPDSVTSIGSSAFSGCTGLNKVNISNIAKWCAIQFGDSSANPLYYAHHLYVNGKEVTELTIPGGVTSIGSSTFSGCTSLTTVTIPNNVTGIGGGAFSGCTGLTSVTIGNGVTSIGRSAFYGCTSIEKLTVGKPIEQFTLAQMTIPKEKLSTVVITDNATKVKDNAFVGCNALTSVTIGNGVTSIGNAAFADCTALASIKTTDNIQHIGKDAFKNTAWYAAQPDGIIYLKKYALGYAGELPRETTLKFKSGTKVIASSAFAGMQWLTGVTLPDSVAYINNAAFADCKNLTEVTIGNGVTRIEPNAFDGCVKLNKVTINNLAAWCGITFESNPVTVAHHLYLNKDEITELVIPDGVTSIEKDAFRGCTNITSVTVPDSVVTIGEGAFADCTSMLDVTIGKGVTRIEANAFDGCDNLKKVNIRSLAAWCGITFDANPTMLAHHLYLNKTEITELVIPDGVTEIAKDAFHGCTDIKSLTIPDGVTSIGATAFKDCVSLAGVAIPASVSSVDANAFSGCSSLRHVEIKDLDAWCGIVFANSAANPLTYAKRIFKNCKELKTLAISDGVKSIGNYAFNNCETVTKLLLPKSIESIGKDAFTGCSSITHLTVGKIAETYVFPATPKLKTLTLLSGTETVRGSMCKDFVELEAVCFPASLKTISDSAFNNCQKLNDVYYAGTEDQWDEVTIGHYNLALTQYAEVHYKNTKIPVDADEEGVTEHLWGDWTTLNDAQHRRVCAFDPTHMETAEHTWNKGKVTQKPTCTETGETIFACADCDATKTETVPATGHSFGEWKKLDETLHQRVCANDKTHVEQENHTWDDGKVTKEPTDKAEGAKTFTCTVCGATKTEPIPKTEPKNAPGDVDGDGKLTSADARLALRASVGLEADIKPGTDAYLAADADGDGKITSADARLILRASVGLEDASQFGKKA